MPNAEAHLRRAADAEAMEASARHSRDREQLLQIAAEWRQLAAETLAGETGGSAEATPAAPEPPEDGSD